MTFHFFTKFVVFGLKKHSFTYSPSERAGREMGKLPKKFVYQKKTKYISLPQSDFGILLVIWSLWPMPSSIPPTMFEPEMKKIFVKLSPILHHWHGRRRQRRDGYGHTDKKSNNQQCRKVFWEGYQMQCILWNAWLCSFLYYRVNPLVIGWYLIW